MPGIYPWFSDWLYKSGGVDIPYTKTPQSSPQPLSYGDSILLYNKSKYYKFAGDGSKLEHDIIANANRCIIDTAQNVDDPSTYRGTQVLYGDIILLTMIDEDAVINNQTIAAVDMDGDSGYRCVYHKIQDSSIRAIDGSSTVDGSTIFTITSESLSDGTPVFYGDEDLQLTSGEGYILTLDQVVNQEAQIPVFDAPDCEYLRPCDSSTCDPDTLLCNDGYPVTLNTDTCQYECTGNLSSVSCTNGDPPMPQTCVSGQCNAYGCTNGNTNPTCTSTGLYDCNLSVPWYYYLLIGLALVGVGFLVFFSQGLV